MSLQVLQNSNMQNPFQNHIASKTPFEIFIYSYNSLHPHEKKDIDFMLYEIEIDNCNKKGNVTWTMKEEELQTYFPLLQLLCPSLVVEYKKQNINSGIAKMFWEPNSMIIPQKYKEQVQKFYETQSIGKKRKM